MVIFGVTYRNEKEENNEDDQKDASKDYQASSFAAVGDKQDQGEKRGGQERENDALRVVNYAAQKRIFFFGVDKFNPRFESRRLLQDKIKVEWNVDAAERDVDAAFFECRAQIVSEITISKMVKLKCGIKKRELNWHYRT